MPDAPVGPAFALRSTGDAARARRPSPVSILTTPPVDTVLRPECRDAHRAAGATSSPLPTVTLTEPPVPPVAVPGPIRQRPRVARWMCPS